jgi:hypothetical protein
MHDPRVPIPAPSDEVPGRIDRERMHEMEPALAVAVLAERANEPHELLSADVFELEADHRLKKERIAPRICSCSID